MDVYLLLRLGHIVGIIVLGGGLLAVFISELRAYRTSDGARFAEAAWYTATFYDALVAPGAVLVAISGFFLILELGLGFFTEPWLIGMWGLFLFEFIEGNTVTRLQFRRTLRRARTLAETGQLGDADRAQIRPLIGQVAHFLDLPLFLVIVYSGVVRPDSWAPILTAIAIAVAATVVLTLTVPKRARP